MSKYLQNSRVPMRAIAAAALLCGATNNAIAQERLTGQRSLGVGFTYETVNFGDDGLLQSAFAGQGASRLKRVQQISTPVSAAIALSKNWTVDATALYSSGTVTYTPVGSTTDKTASLSGLSDVRIRASGRLFTDGVVLTIGINAPTGKTKLDTTGLFALRALASPALALGSTPVGSGPSGTVGLLGVRAVGQWAVALGASYEYRGSYQPITALVAGAPSTDFAPGGVIRASLGLDRVIGSSRFNITTSADIFAEDQLRNADGAGGAPSATLARVQLGPLVSTEAQMRVAAAHTRDIMVWASHRWRAAFARDDKTIEGTSGQYVEGGVNTAIPITSTLDITTAIDGRWHSGLAIDEGLPTAAVQSGTVTLGLSQRAGAFTIQPFARAQVGNVHARGPARDAQNASIMGASFGLVLVSRF